MSQVRDDEVRAHRELERENMHKILDAYIRICNQAGVCIHSSLPLQLLDFVASRNAFLLLQQRQILFCIFKELTM